jgi:hypothetical protein
MHSAPSNDFQWFPMTSNDKLINEMCNYWIHPIRFDSIRFSYEPSAKQTSPNSLHWRKLDPHTNSVFDGRRIEKRFEHFPNHRIPIHVHPALNPDSNHKLDPNSEAPFKRSCWNDLNPSLDIQARISSKMPNQRCSFIIHQKVPSTRKWRLSSAT